MPSPHIVNVGYRSTNYWLIGAGDRRLLVDLGWPGSLRGPEPATRIPSVARSGAQRGVGAQGPQPCASKSGARGEAALGPAPVNAEQSFVAASWELLRGHGARRCFPAHGPIRNLDQG